MADWASRLGQPAAAPAEKPRDWATSLGQTDRNAGMSHPSGLTQNPANTYVKPGEFNLGTSAKAAFFNDPQTKLQAAASSLFPDDPSAVDRFQFVGGRIAFKNPDGSLQYASSRGADFAGNLVSNIPEMVGGAIGAASASPVAGAALGVAGVRGIKRAIAGGIFGEPQTVGGNIADMVLNAGAEAATAGLAKGVLAIGNRGRSIDLTPADLAGAQAKRAGIKAATGVDTDLALASGDRRLIAVRNWLAQQPNQTAGKIQKADEAAGAQFEQATNRVLDQMAPRAPSGTLGQRGVNAAADAIRAARKEVSTAVDPLYKAAYAAVPVVDRTSKQGGEILDYLKLPYFRQAFSAGQKLRALETGSAANPATRSTETLSRGTPEEWARATTDIKSTDTGARVITSRMSEGTRAKTPDGLLTTRKDVVHRDITNPSLEELDYTKRALDAQIEDLAANGQRQRARALKIKRDEFVSRLDALPNSQWQAARAEYGRLAEEKIAPLENGVVGLLAKIPDQRAASAGARLFRDANVSPKDILQARAAISKQDPEAWNGLVRLFVSREFNRAQRVSQRGETTNVPGKLYQSIWGDPTSKARMDTALGSEASQALKGLMETAETLAEAPVRGSNTQPNQAIQRVLEGPAAWWTRVLLNPKSSATQAATERAVDQNAAKLWEALADPAKVRQLRIAVKIPDKTKRIAYVSTVILSQTTKVAAEESTKSEQ